MIVWNNTNPRGGLLDFLSHPPMYILALFSSRLIIHHVVLSVEGALTADGIVRDQKRPFTSQRLSHSKSEKWEEFDQNEYIFLPITNIFSFNGDDHGVDGDYHITLF